MIRKYLIIGLIFLFLIGLTEKAHSETAVKKLGRGFCNVITSPFEILLQMKRTSATDGPMAGLTYGLLKGVVMTGVRTFVGVYEIATFPVPFPKEYQPILKDPEFFFEETNW